MAKITTQKTVNLPPDLARRVEKLYFVPGQNFKWDPYLSHLVGKDANIKEGAKKRALTLADCPNCADTDPGATCDACGKEWGTAK